MKELINNINKDIVTAENHENESTIGLITSVGLGIIGVVFTKNSSGFWLGTSLASNFASGVSNSYILSFPGGSIESESIEENAQRELIEEIGYRSNNMKFLISTYEHPSTTNRRIHVFLARDLEKAYLKNEDRFIKIRRMSIEEAIEKCSKDFCSDITTIAILNILKNYNK